MEVYPNLSFIAIFTVAKNAFAINDKAIYEKAKGKNGKAKAHIGLCIERMLIKII